MLNKSLAATISGKTPVVLGLPITNTSLSARVPDSTTESLSATAPLFAQALLNIANGNSVSSLFDSERLRPIYKPYYPKYHIEKKRKA